MWPSRCCCSTDAGSVSPCVTMMRRNCERSSPGTCCQTGSPKWSPKPMVRSGDRLREENAPTVVGHLHRAIARPALRVHADGRAQIHVGAGEIVRPHLPPPVEKPRLPVLERALQRAVVGEVDVVRNSFAVVVHALH